MTKIYRAIRAWLDRIFDPETPFDLYEMSDDVSQRVKDQTDEIWFDRLAGRGDASENGVPDEIKILRMRTSAHDLLKPEITQEELDEQLAKLAEDERTVETLRTHILDVRNKAEDEISDETLAQSREKLLFAVRRKQQQMSEESSSEAPMSESKDYLRTRRAGGIRILWRFHLTAIYRELVNRRLPQTMFAYLAVAWVLFQVTNLVVTSYAFPTYILNALLLVLAIGLPLSLIATWMLNIQPREPSFTLARQQSRLSRIRPLPALGLIVVFTVAGSLAYLNFYPSDIVRHPPAEPVVAVLPFTVLTDKISDGIAGYGLAEELHTRLAQLSRLHVLSRELSWSVGLEKPPLLISDIATRTGIGVTHVIVGSITKGDEHILIVIELYNAEGHIQWSQRYSAQEEDMLGIRDELVSSIVADIAFVLLEDLQEAPD